MHQVHQFRSSQDDDSGTAPAARNSYDNGQAAVEFISVPEWCKRVRCSLDAGYRAARRDEITGLFRIGRLMRINWQAFVAATFSGGGDRRVSRE